MAININQSSGFVEVKLVANKVQQKHKSSIVMKKYFSVPILKLNHFSERGKMGREK